MKKRWMMIASGILMVMLLAGCAGMQQGMQEETEMETEEQVVMGEQEEVKKELATEIAVAPEMTEFADVYMGEYELQVEDTTVAPFVLTMTKFWKDDPEAIWVYAEGWKGEMLDTLKTQEITRVTMVDSATFMVKDYQFTGDPAMYKGASRDKSKLMDLTREDIEPVPAGELMFHRQETGVYTAEVDLTDQYAELEGATAVKQKVEINPDFMRSVVKGYDDEGNEVWVRKNYYERVATDELMKGGEVEMEMGPEDEPVEKEVEEQKTEE